MVQAAAEIDVDMPPAPDVIRIKQGPDIVEITVDDLEGDFQIEVVDSRRTPFSDQAVRDAVLQLLGPLQQLWEIIQKGGPGAVLAKAQMEAIVEKFDLPKDMHPESLEQALAEMTEEQAEKEAEMGQQAPPQEPQGGPPPAQGPQAAAAPAQTAQPGPPPPPQGGGLPPEVVQQLLAAPPQQALQQLGQLLQQAGAPPELLQQLQRASQLPPDQQAQFLQQLLQQLGAQ